MGWDRKMRTIADKVVFPEGKQVARFSDDAVSALRGTQRSEERGACVWGCVDPKLVCVRATRRIQVVCRCKIQGWCA